MGDNCSIALDIKRMARKGSISSSFSPYFPHFPSDFTFQNVKKTRLLHLQVTVISPNDIRLPKNMWLYFFSIEAERNSPLSMRLFLLWLLFFSVFLLSCSESLSPLSQRGISLLHLMTTSEYPMKR